MIGLYTPSRSYKPFRYPWAFEYWKIQQQVHWLPEEIALAEDCRDWAKDLTDTERHLLTQIFRFFTQADVEVNDNYMGRYARRFRPTEVKMMLSAFSNIETVHIAAYAYLLETIGMPESEFAAFLNYKEMVAKHDYMSGFNVDTDYDVARTLAVFAAFIEGLQLFASFAMLLNFPRFNKMKGMGQVVTWSIRDESLHCEGMINLFHAFCEETGVMGDRLRTDLYEQCRIVVAHEDAFIDLAFELGDVQGLTAQDVKQYIRYVADWRLTQLGLEHIFHVNEHPMPWLLEITNGVEHTNFFEQRATEYSKAATKGTWHDLADPEKPPGVWSQFDERMAKLRETKA